MRSKTRTSGKKSLGSITSSKKRQQQSGMHVWKVVRAWRALNKAGDAVRRILLRQKFFPGDSCGYVLSAVIVFQAATRTPMHVLLEMGPIVSLRFSKVSVIHARFSGLGHWHLQGTSAHSKIPRPKCRCTNIPRDEGYGRRIQWQKETGALRTEEGTVSAPIQGMLQSPATQTFHLAESVPPF